jgi:chaperonin GroEL
LDDAHVLISNVSVQEPEQLIPLLDRAARAGVTKLVLVGLNFSGRAVGLILHNQQAGVMQVIAVRAPYTDALKQAAALEDLAQLTRGRVINSAAGETLERAQVADLGRVRRAWATMDEFGIVGGKGDPRAVRRYFAELKQQAQRADGATKEELRERLGQLTGGAAIVRVGAATESESKLRIENTERAVRALRNAVQAGVVPGGGTALAACRAALMAFPDTDPAQIAAQRILTRALEEPLRVIAGNAGYDADAVITRVCAAPQGHGLDARSGEICNLYDAGITDPVAVLEKAVRTAISGATMAFTTDVIVHRKRPTESIEP